MPKNGLTQKTGFFWNLLKSFKVILVAVWRQTRTVVFGKCGPITLTKSSKVSAMLCGTTHTSPWTQSSLALWPVQLVSYKINSYSQLISTRFQAFFKQTIRLGAFYLTYLDIKRWLFRRLEILMFFQTSFQRIFDNAHIYISLVSNQPQLGPRHPTGIFWDFLISKFRWHLRIWRHFGRGVRFYSHNEQL